MVKFCFKSIRSNTKVKISLNAALVVLLLLTQGCGRMGYPFAPEDLGAQAVGELTVTPQANALEFSWQAPKDDIKGEQLKSLDSYAILRKTISQPSDYLDSTIEFELVGEVSDRYLEKLLELQEDALSRGLPRRRIKVDQEYITHRYIDDSVKTGQRYLYQIVPVNQGNVRGQVEYFVDLVFNGENTKIELTNSLDAEDSI